MRLTVLALALAATLATDLGAQLAPDGPIALPVHGPKPADVVARLARRALAQPGDSTNWKALAGALPELALVGSADLEATFDAARVADSLSAVSPADEVVPGAAALPAAAVPSASSRVRGALTGLRTRAGSFLGSLPDTDPRLFQGLAFALLALVATWGLARVRRTVVRARLRARYRARKDAKQVAAPPTTPAAGRLWTARALASGGAQVADIARQVGIAQEAVALALRLNGAGPMPAAAATAPQAPAAAPADARLRRELRAGIGHLRDGRLTYGGGSR